MANPDRARGFVPVNTLGGGCCEPVTHPYKAKSTAVAMGRGDLVAMETGGSGSIERAAADAAYVVGVFWGCRYTDASGKLVYSTYKPASQTNYDSSLVDCFVVDNPDQLFAVQCDDDSGAAIAQTVVGLTANHLDTAPTQLGTGGRSNHELDNSSLAGAGTATQTLKVVGLFKEVGQVFSATEATSRFGWVVVKIHEHFLASGAAATAINPGV